MAKYNVIFNRKKKTDREGLSLIEISVFYNGKRQYKSTGFRISERQWDAKAQRVTNHPKAAQINATISQYLSGLQQREVELISKMKPYTVADITADGDGKDSSRPCDG